MTTDYRTQFELTRIPRHVAIIMDGNGRWARSHGMDRSAGHVEGVNTVRRITEIASELGVGYLTLYTFSTENWQRPKAEVDMLMHLIVTAIERETPDLIKNNVRLLMIGDTDRLPTEALERLKRCMADTAHCTGLRLVLALSYSSRWEIVRACRSIAREAAEGRLNPDSIDEATVDAYLATAGMPEPDLLIRTGGDRRISNFLLWQLAYTEIYITDKYWPDFRKEDFCKALHDYQHRERRFGLTGDQVRQVQSDSGQTSHNPKS